MPDFQMDIVDAFTRVPFRGNPAAVFLLDEYPADDLLQSIAQEINLSETAFLVPVGSHTYELRWFTPTREIDLCGHATLASAHVLKERGLFGPGDRLTFNTSGGTLYCTCVGNAIELSLPMLAGTHATITPELQRCLHVPIKMAEFNGVNYLVEVEDVHALRLCQPDMDAIKELDALGLIVTTAVGCEPYDFASRYFAPGAGVPEDPVTGSAHSFLAPYWATLQEKTHFRAFQASKRTGVLDIRVEGERVYMAGHCVTTMRGTLNTGEAYALDHAA